MPYNPADVLAIIIGVTAIMMMFVFMAILADVRQVAEEDAKAVKEAKAGN